MHSSAHRHKGPAADKATSGLVLGGGWRYDLHGWLFDTFMFRGQGREIRRRALALASLRPGEQVLDVGCGTGSLALEAQQHVGANGRVCGIDPGDEQIARARAKAAWRRAPVEFQHGVIEQLPFPDQTFDVVLSTLMMHHIPASLRRQGVAEIARVLKPGGRVVIADFTRKQERTGRAAHFHAGGSRLEDLAALVADAGFSRVETQQLQALRFSAFPGAGFVEAYNTDRLPEVSDQDTPAGHAPAVIVSGSDRARSLATRRHPLVLAGGALAIIAAIGLHAVGGMAVLKAGFGGFSLHSPLSYVMIGLLLGVGVLKLTYLLAFLQRKR